MIVVKNEKPVSIGTAAKVTNTTVKMLRYWEEKGYISASEFHNFACEVVPLARMEKTVWLNSEIFKAQVDITNYSYTDLVDSKINWELSFAKDGSALDKGQLSTSNIPTGNVHTIGTIHTDLKEILIASKLKLKISVANSLYKNEWDLWVYPEKADKIKMRNSFLARLTELD